MSFVVILDAALSAVLIGFNGWNWFLAMSGYSTIEFWGKQTRVSIKRGIISNLGRSLKI